MRQMLKLKSPADFIGKQGPGVISFGSGQPDLPPPKEAFEGLDLTRDLRYGLIQGEPKLRQALSKVPGVRIPYPGPCFNEFVIRLNRSAEHVAEAMRSRGILAGVPLSRWFAEYPQDLLVCATEMRTQADLDAYATALKGVR